jgi:hypothetical protein
VDNWRTEREKSSGSLTTLIKDIKENLISDQLITSFTLDCSTLNHTGRNTLPAAGFFALMTCVVMEIPNYYGW